VGVAASLPPPDPGLHTTGKEDGGQRGGKQRGLLEHFGLEPASDLLEVGCGIGRLAYELADFVVPPGSYTGFDISETAIDWLNQNYAPLLPNFTFDFLDVQNPRFHPDGAVTSTEASFPYPDDSFDMVCAFEVFMHMEPEGVCSYLNEVARVLRPSGRAVVTFMMILNPDRPGRHAGRAFVPVGDGVYSRFPERSGWSMGYLDRVIREMVSGAALSVDEAIEGTWHYPWGRPDPGVEHGCDLYVLSAL
jgi:SAM-dependent methyltransferase